MSRAALTTGIDIAPGRKGEPGRTTYGYDWHCRDPKAEHGHDMYGRCYIPSTKPPWTAEGIAAAIRDDAPGITRANCRTCGAQITRDEPKGRWEHLNSKKVSHRAKGPNRRPLLR